MPIYKCDVPGCTYLTARSNNYKRHEMTHTGKALPFVLFRQVVSKHAELHEGPVFPPSLGPGGRSPALSLPSAHSLPRLTPRLQCAFAGEKPFACDEPGCTYATVSPAKPARANTRRSAAPRRMEVGRSRALYVRLVAALPGRELGNLQPRWRRGLGGAPLRGGSWCLGAYMYPPSTHSALARRCRPTAERWSAMSVFTRGCGPHFAPGQTATTPAQTTPIWPATTSPTSACGRSLAPSRAARTPRRRSARSTATCRAVTRAPVTTRAPAKAVSTPRTTRATCGRTASGAVGRAQVIGSYLRQGDARLGRQR